MSQENVDRLRAGYDAFNTPGNTRAGLKAGTDDLLADDFELHQAPSVVGTAGVFRGQNALRDSLREVREAFDALSYEVEKCIEGRPGEVVVFVHAAARGRASGVETDLRIAHVWTFRDRKAVRMVVYENRADALKAVGLE